MQILHSLKGITNRCQTHLRGTFGVQRNLVMPQYYIDREHNGVYDGDLRLAKWPPSAGIDPKTYKDWAHLDPEHGGWMSTLRRGPDDPRWAAITEQCRLMYDDAVALLPNAKIGGYHWPFWPEHKAPEVEQGERWLEAAIQFHEVVKFAYSFPVGYMGENDIVNPKGHEIRTNAWRLCLQFQRLTGCHVVPHLCWRVTAGGPPRRMMTEIELRAQVQSVREAEQIEGEGFAAISWWTHGRMAHYAYDKCADSANWDETREVLDDEWEAAGIPGWVSSVTPEMMALQDTQTVEAIRVIADELGNVIEGEPSLPEPEEWEAIGAAVEEIQRNDVGMADMRAKMERLYDDQSRRLDDLVERMG